MARTDPASRVATPVPVRVLSASVESSIASSFPGRGNCLWTSTGTMEQLEPVIVMSDPRLLSSGKFAKLTSVQVGDRVLGGVVDPSGKPGVKVVPVS